MTIRVKKSLFGAMLVAAFTVIGGLVGHELAGNIADAQSTWQAEWEQIALEDRDGQPTDTLQKILGQIPAGCQVDSELAPDEFDERTWQNVSLWIAYACP